MRIYHNMQYAAWVVIILSSISCKNGPKEIIPNTTVSGGQVSSSSGIFSEDGGTSSTNTHPIGAVTDVREIEAIEVLPTDKYVYIKAREGDQEYWVATSKQEVKVGEKYFFKSGLLKRNFYSKEYDRTFDELYLVSSIVTSAHSGQPQTQGTDNVPQEVQVVIKDIEGSIKIKDIVANPEKYNGKEIQISGTCTKINPNIMSRNWLHIKDGSKDDFDMVVTSNVAVPVGHFVTLKGVVTLKKDFGAGYYYDLIIEDGQIIQ